LLFVSVTEMQGQWWRTKSITWPSLPIRMAFSYANK